MHACEVDAEVESVSDASSSGDDSDGEQLGMVPEAEETHVQAVETKNAIAEKGFENGSDVAFPEGGILCTSWPGLLIR